MGSPFPPLCSSRFALLLAVSACIFLSLLPHPAFSVCNKPPVIFNFGDSNSDTGGLVAGLGFNISSPNGRTFFGSPAGRLSDGRLIIDFLCQSVNTSFLRPYMEPLGAPFENGANFAVVGSSTLPEYLPFSLNIQVMQFLRFRARSLQLATTSGVGNLINDQEFKDALYMIDIGQNDLADSFSRNISYAEAMKKISSVLVQIKNAVKAIHDQGGRKFWIHNTGPLGCLPQKLSMVQHSSKDLDPYGCLSSYNNAAKVFNEGLRRLCEKMRFEMKDATILYVDIYAIKYDLIANYAKNGFSSPLMACCGYGGPPYNYNIHVPCGQPNSQVCNQGIKYVSWDGVHYTEAANYNVASKILSMAYSTPRIPFHFFCRG